MPSTAEVEGDNVEAFVATTEVVTWTRMSSKWRLPSLKDHFQKKK